LVGACDVRMPLNFSNARVSCTHAAERRHLALVTIFKDKRRCNRKVMVYTLLSLDIAGGTLLAPAPNPNSLGI
jgi:hypothetical protein